MRIKGTGTPGHERGLAMALDGNGRWAYLNPKLGAMHAVAEAARKVACTGATPVAATNCLNFGNPEKPEIMAQLSAAIDGIAEACTALGTPITGGNVSLYNETRGEGIYPTPVLGIVGILDDVTKAVPAHFPARRRRHPAALADSAPAKSPTPISQVPLHPEPVESQSPIRCSRRSARAAQSRMPKTTRRPKPSATAELAAFGSSEYAKVVLGGIWGQPPPLDLDAEADLHTLLAVLGRPPTAPLRPRHLRRRHCRCPGAGRIPAGNWRHRRAGAVAHGSSALRPLRRAGLDHARHRRPQPGLRD